MGEPSDGKKSYKPLIDRETDPVKNFERWKKKYNQTKEKCKLQRKEAHKPLWQIEKESISRLEQRYSEINISEIVKFSDFPLSKNTVRGLIDAQYRLPTEIQKQTIGLALQGKDVLGAAKTGSGKTLAFVIPALECLYRQQWMAVDGLGVLVISPTRELAYQTFEVLRKVGRYHEFSAGLVIGGKDLKHESACIHRTNILICTPGRLLQHMDQTSLFDTCNLKMLILDEADRILDMGFSETMNAILENLPVQRQTLLFSATQTKSVKDLARLSLKDPQYVWVHDKAMYSTPATLEQNYVVCDLTQKINLLFSFLKNHLKKKSIVFFSSCKEVQYIYRVFCRLRPGIQVLALYGKQQQMKRMDVYNEFVRKKFAVLFATDIAARGLDFPAVNWVLQLDCPEDANTYIHRVGRTARYKEGGEALLVLLPSEEKGMLQQLQEKKVPINKIKINPSKLQDVRGQLESFLAQEQEMKERAQRCFVSYLRSVYLMKNKEVFDVFKIPLVEYAQSLGLAVPPRVRFLQNVKASENKPTEVLEPGNASDEEIENFKAQLSGKNLSKMDKRNIKSDEQSSGDEEEEEEEEDSEEEKLQTNNKPSGFQLLDGDDDDEDEGRDEEIFTVKRRDIFGINEDKKEVVKEEITKTKLKKMEKVSKVKEAKKVLKKKFQVNTKIVFEDDGKAVQQWPPAQKTMVDAGDDDVDQNGIDLAKAKQLLTKEDQFDKEAYRKRIKEKHREKRLKEKAERRGTRSGQEEDMEESGAYLDQVDGDEIDLSYLPDPDKYREDDGEEGNDDEDKDQEEDSGEESDSDDEEMPSGKRTLTSKSKNSEGNIMAAKKRKTEEPPEPLDTGLSLREDEELVLHLLGNIS